MTDEISPIRKQYLDIKEKYPDAIVLFRLGDFYETFDRDAEVASRELEIVLTSRNVAKGMRIPMAGIPFHAADSYIARLIQHGHHVAICEQVGEAVKGLMPREVLRVITPGTVMEQGMLRPEANNYLACAWWQEEQAAVAYADISTGEFRVTEFAGADALNALRAELVRLDPAEVLFPEDAQGLGEFAIPGAQTKWPVWRFEAGRCEQTLLRHFEAATLESFGLGGKPAAARAVGVIVQYLLENQAGALRLLKEISTYSLSEFMVLDPATRRGLELTETLRRGEARGSLLGVLDATKTSMGGRLLRQWVVQPLLDINTIVGRQQGVQDFLDAGLVRSRFRESLGGLMDIERLTGRILAGHAHPRDLAALRTSLGMLPIVVAPLQTEEGTPRFDLPLPDVCSEVLDELIDAIAEDPPISLSQSGVIRAGFNPELDEIHRGVQTAREWIAGLEAVERERTGIRTLKVGFNRVFGYYIEITHAKARDEVVPPDYIRKQTLVNAERYITPEMKEYEAQILNAEERIREVETRLFREVSARVSAESVRLLGCARVLARLDCLAALAEVAARNGYCRPVVEEGPVLEIRAGRHPVVEQFLAAERFVPNDIVLEEGERIRIITGPNMSGKSTYLRQAGLLCLMAQIGSFVPAQSARIGLVDRIFARIGAQDEIHAGQSTFMVEMVETANILHHATRRSLLIFDEVGRGTSTYDGVSIAWAVIEYIHNHPRLQARTLFATHYHELIRLADALPRVRNYNVAVAEEAGKVVFLHQIVPGGADRSYGIHVAQLAGLPRPAIHRAEEILRELESGSPEWSAPTATPKQMALFPEANPLLRELEGLDLASLTPLEALSRLFDWQKKYLEKK
jgi:DNA mismatch repair protein MutS